MGGGGVIGAVGNRSHSARSHSVPVSNGPVAEATGTAGTPQRKTAYKPYTLKEYKERQENFRLGGLGPNMNDEWRERHRKLEMMQDFARKVKTETGAKL